MAKNLDSISPPQEQEDENLDSYFDGDDRPDVGPYDPDMPEDPEDSYDDEFADDPNFYDYNEDYESAAGEPQEDQRSSGDEEKASKLDKAKEATDTAKKIAKTAAKTEGKGMVVSLLGALGIEATPIAIGCAVILIVVVLVVIIFLSFMAIGNLDRAEGQTNENQGGPMGMCSIELPEARSDGRVQLPEPSAVGNVYDLNITGNSPRNEQWGKPELVKVIIAASTEWNSKHPEERIGVGDLDEIGDAHASHKNGVDADLFSNNSIFWHLPNAGVNPNYNKALAVELGKYLFDTDSIEWIFYDDPAVVAELTRYVKQNNLHGQIEPWKGTHHDHFHVRIKAEWFTQKCAESNSGGTVSDADALKYCSHDYGFYSTSEAMKLFGSSESEVRKQLVEEEFGGSKWPIHKKMAPCFRAAVKEINASGILKKYKVVNDGSFNWRHKIGGSSLSMHSFGIAFDMNAGYNCWQCNRTDIPKEISGAFKKYGFSWGYEWSSVKDPMHFEWHGAKP